MVPLRILLVDDEPNMLESLGDVLRREGHQVLKATDGDTAIEIASRENLDLVITDLKMPGKDGIALLKELRRKASAAEVVIMTGYGTIDSAVEAMKFGAYHYLLKPFRPRLILHTVRRVAEHKALPQESQLLSQAMENQTGLGRLIGNSAVMRKVFEQVCTIAPTDATVLITGESGTGKELVAHAIHFLSRRRNQPLIKVSCASLPETLLESELFGHERRAFTSAIERKKGRFELANGGTLFLDEIGDISPPVQAKLVRVLETREFERVGGTETLRVDVRLIAATHKDLSSMVEKGLFREDLYYRINVVPIHLPPLRERTADIPALANYFVGFYSKRTGKNVTGIDDGAMELLRAYPWPGNIRELRNYMERAVLFCRGQRITAGDLPEALRKRGKRLRLAGPRNKTPTIREAQKRLIRDALQRADWNLSKAAASLGISRGTLYNKIERYGLRRPKSRKE